MDPVVSRYTTRRAVPADLQALVALGAADLHYHLSLRPDLPPVELSRKRARYAEVMAADNGCLVVVEADPPGVPVGMVVAFVKPVARPGAPRILYVEEAYVSRDHRQRGLLRRMMGHLADWGLRHGVDRIDLEWVAGNAGGEAAWRALGFEPRSIKASASLEALRRRQLPDDV